MGEGEGPGQSAQTISAVLADIDGTLVTKDKVLTERAIQAVNELRKRGIIFTVCSGRPPRGLRMLVEPLHLTMPMAAFNGGVIVMPDLSVLDERALPEGVHSRVVSMPSWDIFEHQPKEYRDSVLPPGITARVAIEQASAFGWERYVGSTGRVIGMQTFGASAPLKAPMTEYGFTVENVVAAAKGQLAPAPQL